MKLLKNVYFVNRGQRTGQFLILLDFNSDNKNYSVLGVPESEALYITEDEIEKGIQSNLLEFVEELPTDIYETCKSEFQYRINNK
jgi:hypothetical protein